MDTLGAMVVPIATITENTVMKDTTLTSHSGMISSIVKAACLSQCEGEIDLDQPPGALTTSSQQIRLFVSDLAATSIGNATHPVTRSDVGMCCWNARRNPLVRVRQ